METLVKSLEETVTKFGKRLNTVRPMFLNLDEKVKKIEKRLDTIEEHIFKNKESELNAQQILSDPNMVKIIEELFSSIPIQPDILNKYKLLEETVYANKEALNKIESDSKSDHDFPEPVDLRKNSERRCKFWNAGYCKYQKDCHMRHPEDICKKENCNDKTCNDRHPRPCKHWKTGSCKFGLSCEFTHNKNIEMEQKKAEEYNCDNEKEGNINKDNIYIDYDNIDSEDDSYDDTENKFKCQQCEFRTNMKSNVTKHVKSEHSISCDKCDFKTSNKMHLNMHVKACHKKIELNKVNEQKKRKLTDDIPSSRKKTKNNVVSKKVRVKC